MFRKLLPRTFPLVHESDLSVDEMVLFMTMMLEDFVYLQMSEHLLKDRGSS